MFYAYVDTYDGKRPCMPFVREHVVTNPNAVEAGMFDTYDEAYTAAKKMWGAMLKDHLDRLNAEYDRKQGGDE